MGMFGGKPAKQFSGFVPGNIPSIDEIVARQRGETPAPEITGPLSDQERADFAANEGRIEHGLNTFKEVGDALIAIRDGRQYRESYASFEDYVMTRWNMKRNYAYKLISAAEVVDNLEGVQTSVGTIVPTPTNEAQARELAKLNDVDQVLVWKAVAEAAEKTGGNATAGLLKDMAETLVEIRDTGYLTINEELQLPASKLFEERLQRDAEERMARQKEHIDASKKKQAHVANASGENEWYTPTHIIEAARSTMTSIDCDPATHEAANANVRAPLIYTLENSGLDFNSKWRGNVWLNPPYSTGLIEEFIGKLKMEYNEGTTQQACVLVNNATETQWFQSLLKVAVVVCLIKGRVKFISPREDAGGGPLQGQVVLYLGERVTEFSEHFGPLGVICHVA